VSDRPTNSNMQEKIIISLFDGLVCLDLISQISGVCLAQVVGWGAQVASPPRVNVEFELARALAHELRNSGAPGAQCS